MEISVTSQAPRKEPISVSAMAGSRAGQRSSTRRAYCVAENAVPQTEADLLVPKRVAALAPG